MDILYLATFLVTLIASLLSGMAGGGGGFVLSPYWLIAGMTPAQGAATGAFMATGMSISSVAAFRKTDHFPKNRKFDRTERIAGTSRIRLLSKERDEPSPEPEYSLSGQTALRQLFRNSRRLKHIDALLLHLLDFGNPQAQSRVNRLALQSLSRKECQGRPDEHRKC